ncbi:Protein misato 1, partial [Quaeritorhiza haematococci]
SFGALKTSSELYEGEGSHTSSTWTGHVTTFREEPYAKNSFQRYLEEQAYGSAEQQAEEAAGPPTFSSDLESSVSVWSDYNKMYYHPRTIVELSQYKHNDATNPFMSFVQGRDILRDSDMRDAILDDHLRYFIEECDAFQGFNVVTEYNTAFGGLASDLLVLIRDEMPKIAITTFGLGVHPSDLPSSPAKAHQKSAISSVNTSLATKFLSDASSVFVPIWSPTVAEHNRYLNINYALKYHWSAYLAAAIDTITFPARSKNIFQHSLDAASLVNSNGKTPLASLQTGIPVPISDTPSGFEQHSKEAPSIRTQLESVFRGGKPDPSPDWLVDLCSGTRAKPGVEYGQFSVLRGVGACFQS